MMELITGVAVGLIILCIIGKIIALPMRLLWKFITNSITGAILLWVVKLVDPSTVINVITALIAGIFGIPGVIVVLIYSHM